jgi:hypothetical protein
MDANAENTSLYAAALIGKNCCRHDGRKFWLNDLDDFAV